MMIDNYELSTEAERHLRGFSKRLREAMIALIKQHHYNVYDFIRHAEKLLADHQDEFAAMIQREQIKAFYRAARTLFDVSVIGKDPITKQTSPKLIQIDKAADWLRSRIAYTPAEWETLEHEAKTTGLTVARQASEQTITKLRDAMALGVDQGATVRQFQQLVRDTIDVSPISDAHLETLYRTHSGKAYSAGQIAVMQHTGDEFPYLEYSATHDSRVRPEHLEMEKLGIQGTAVYRADDPIWRRFYPPWAWNCALPGTKVEGEFLAGTRSFYSGKAVEIITQSGAVIRVTSKHPILTSQGWTFACNIQSGDKLFHHVRQTEIGGMNVAMPIDPDGGPSQINNGPSLIEDVFGTLSAFGFHEHRRAETADFHGDGEFLKGNVDVVWADSKLLVASEARRFKSGDDFRNEHSGAGNMSGSGLPVPLPVAHSGPFKTLRIGLTSQLDARLREISFNNKPWNRMPFGNDVNGITIGVLSHDGGNVNDGFPRTGIHPEPSHPLANGFRVASELLGDLKNSQPGLISIDEVLSVNVIEYTGHVFDLQSVSGCIVAEGTLIANCRCIVIPLSIEDAASRGIHEAQEWLRTGIPPEVPEWVQSPPFDVPPGWVPTGAGLSANITVGERH